MCNKTIKIERTGEHTYPSISRYVPRNGAWTMAKNRICSRRTMATQKKDFTFIFEWNWRQLLFSCKSTFRTSNSWLSSSPSPSFMHLIYIQIHVLFRVSRNCNKSALCSAARVCVRRALPLQLRDIVVVSAANLNRCVDVSLYARWRNCGIHFIPRDTWDMNDEWLSGFQARQFIYCLCQSQRYSSERTNVHINDLRLISIVNTQMHGKCWREIWMKRLKRRWTSQSAVCSSGKLLWQCHHRRSHSNFTYSDEHHRAIDLRKFSSIGDRRSMRIYVWAVLTAWTEHLRRP